MGKGNNMGDKSFLLFQQHFQGASFKEVVNSLPTNKVLDLSKLKEFAGDNFEFDGNGRKFSKQVENTVGKGEIAHYIEQFLLFPKCFQRTSTADT